MRTTFVSRRDCYALRQWAGISHKFGAATHSAIPAARSSDPKFSSCERSAALACQAQVRKAGHATPQTVPSNPTLGTPNESQGQEYFRIPLSVRSPYRNPSLRDNRRLDPRPQPYARSQGLVIAADTQNRRRRHIHLIHGVFRSFIPAIE